jgi:hypothetical protein
VIDSAHFPDWGSSIDYLDAAVSTNILPKGMSRIELLTGYRNLIQRIFDWHNFEQRACWVSLPVSAAAQNLPLERPGSGTSAALRARLESFPASLRPNLERLLAHTEAGAPFMLPAVVRLLFRYAFEAARVPVICGEIERQIEIEKNMAAEDVQ